MKKTTTTGLMTAVAVSVAAMAPQMAAAAGHERSVSAHASLERRLQQMEAELDALRQELAASRAETKAEVKATEQKVEAKQAAVEEELQAHKKEKKNMIFFRGGYADMVTDRGNQVFSDLYAKDNGGALGPINDGTDGAYFGAGLDYVISDNLFGLMDGTEFLGEVMFDWKRWESQTGNKGSSAVVPTAATLLDNGVNVNPNGTNVRGVTLSQFTLSASPKIKFLQGSAFRPWLIPVGMTFNVISPPSDAGTVLAPGAMFGIGFDYNIWENLFVGLDGRYNLVAQELDGVKADHYEIGGYVGFGF